MDPSAASRTATSTSSIASRIAGDNSNGSESMMSPIGSPAPGSASQFATHARRRSYVSEEAEAWARQTNGKMNGDSPRFRQNSADNGFKRPLSVNTAFGDSSNGNGHGRMPSSADGFIMSPQLETGGFESKLSRISDATEENERLSDDDEATGLTEADRKRRQQLRGRPRPGDADDPGGSGGPGGLLHLERLAEASVMRRSVINVGLIGMWYFFSLSISIVRLLLPTFNSFH